MGIWFLLQQFKSLFGYLLLFDYFFWHRKSITWKFHGFLWKTKLVLIIYVGRFRLSSVFGLTTNSHLFAQPLFDTVPQPVGKWVCLVASVWRIKNFSVLYANINVKELLSISRIGIAVPYNEWMVLDYAVVRIL
jgi:hypothetical protein